MISIKTALKHAYADLPSRGSGTVKGVVYRITFKEKVFGVVYSTITIDYKTGRLSFGLGVLG